jgi:hypothetical protein
VSENTPSKPFRNHNFFANPFRAITFEFEVNISLDEAVENLRAKNGIGSWFMGTKTDVDVFSAQPDLYEFKISRYGDRLLGAEAIGYLKRIDDTSVLVSGKLRVGIFFYLTSIVFLILTIIFVLNTPRTFGFDMFIFVPTAVSLYLWLRANYERISLVNWMKDSLKKKSC